MSIAPPYRMFDELCLKAPGRSAEQVEHDIIVAARSHPEGFLELRRNPTPDAGLLVLALHQIVDSFIAGLLTEEAFEWLAERQKFADQIAPEFADPTDGGHRAHASVLPALTVWRQRFSKFPIPHAVVRNQQVTFG